jgi:CRISPR-associated protein Cas1
MPIIQHLIVDQYGAFLGKHSERLRVSKGKEKLVEAPLLTLEMVLITTRGVSISADAVRACSERGIPIHFLGFGGKPYASLYAAGLTGTVRTRRAQLLAFEDERGVALAKAFASGKVQNQANLLKYMAKYRKAKDLKLHHEVRAAAEKVSKHVSEISGLRAERVDELRLQLLSAEGRAAKEYWSAVKSLLLADLDWPGRRTRGAKDPLNSALNYGYGILYSQVERAAVLAGLDPYAGYLHADRPGKPSLVLDMIEEFRQTVVDRTVFGLVNKGVSIALDDHGRLDEPTRRTLAEKVLARLEAGERHEGKKQSLRIILQTQARHVATFVRGDRAKYTPFVARW